MPKKEAKIKAEGGKTVTISIAPKGTPLDESSEVEAYQDPPETFTIVGADGKILTITIAE